VFYSRSHTRLFYEEFIVSTFPLVVGLNGTLIRTDMLHESALQVLHDKPFDVLRIPYWLSRGKIALKRNLARYASFTPEALPFNRDLLDWLKQERSKGRKIILCTASDLPTATAIADHLGVFDEVIASAEDTNLAGICKAEALEKRFARRSSYMAMCAPRYYRQCLGGVGRKSERLL